MFFVFIYLINLYIRPQDWIPAFYGWPVDYLIIIPALIYAFMANASDEHKPMVTPIYKLLFALLILVFLSNAVHGNISFGIEQFIKYLKLVAVFIVFALLINSTGKLKHTMFFIVALSAFIAGQAIFQYISGQAGLAGQDFYHSGVGIRTKWVGLWDGANIMALVFNVSIPFALEFIFGSYSFFYRITNMLFLSCLVGGVYTTNSRGGFVAMLATLLIYPLFKLKKKKIALIVGAVLAIITLAYFAPNRMSEVSTSESSAYARVRIWNSGLEMFIENKLFGVGQGKYAENCSRGLIAHSNFMQILGELGGLGIFVWMSIMYFSFKALFRSYKTESEIGTNENTLRSLSRALLVSMLSFNICTLFVTMEIDLFYLLIGLCAATVNIVNREVNPIEMNFESRDFAIILAGIVGMLAFYIYYIKTS